MIHVINSGVALSGVTKLVCRQKLYDELCVVRWTMDCVLMDGIQKPPGVGHRKVPVKKWRWSLT
jgi:hypothetical protein